MVHAVQNPSTGGGRFYLDSTLKNSDGFSGNLTPNNAILSVGARYRPAAQAFLDGLLDELRFRTLASSADWITTEYNNQDDVGTFWGTVTDAGGGVTANNSARRQHLMMM